MKTNRRRYEIRRGFRLLLKPELYSEIDVLSKEQGMSMTGFITRAVIRFMKHEDKFDEQK